LTPTGTAQARAHLAWLREHPPARLVTSPLGRARATAAIIGDGLGLTPEPDQALAERCMGIYEGWTLEEIAAAHPREYAARNADLWAWRPPQGENYDDLVARTAPIATRLAAQPEARIVGGVVGLVPEAVADVGSSWSKSACSARGTWMPISTRP
jgi:broad specificity phosphatase PhoE